MRNDRGLTAWIGQLGPELLVCGQPHPGDADLLCGKPLGHSTLGRDGRERMHTGTWVDGRPVSWTLLEDHKWRLDQKRRGRHPAGGDESR